MTQDAAGKAAFAVPDLGAVAIEALQRHPAFDEAMQKAARSMVELYRGNWVLNRLVNDRGRVVLGLMILDLDYTVEAGRGFTAAQLAEQVAAFGVCSRGRLMAFLAALRLTRLLQPIADEDRRLRRLAPTEQCFALHRARLRHLFEALVLLRPSMAAAITSLESPRFIGATAHALVETFRRGIRVVDFVPALRPIAERDTGMVVMIALLLADMTGSAVSIAALARLFSVSRAHVLTILRDAQESGLAATDGPRGGYRAGPALLPTFRRFFAVMFLLQMHAIGTATEPRRGHGAERGAGTPVAVRHA